MSNFKARVKILDRNHMYLPVWGKLTNVITILKTDFVNMIYFHYLVFSTFCLGFEVFSV